MDLLDWAGLAATTTGAALLYTLTGFGFAVLAAPLFLLFVDPPRAIQLVIIISTALSVVTLPGLWRAIAPALMLRLALGSLVGLPLGLVAFRYADPVQVRALVGATILGFAVLLALRQRRGAGEPRGLLGLRPSRDLATGAVSGLATALVGMAVPWVRYLNTLLAIWLFISAWALPTTQVGTVWNNVLVAIAVFIVSLVPSGPGERAPGFFHRAAPSRPA